MKKNAEIDYAPICDVCLDVYGMVGYLPKCECGCRCCRKCGWDAGGWIVVDGYMTCSGCGARSAGMTE